ncbi:class I SAM-dependent methyltransferase [Phytoactinopolyspora halotolerans]|uniref:Class I SAM-dependent methyltransferase n=1 Tax=Phytoactinopolyspora halotolerans TaxID=1981512 RepID=A0A6L9SA05_9ACTN|nr:class I SAM-dependent methyltransferase [Phytoactinopolyspora halotolerans]NEE01521.1 class I SAM-dependent methyltransferase [Phytoactinopolyspora halotolerans]
MTFDQPSVEQDLVTYYDQEATTRAQRDLSPERHAWRAQYTELLHSENRTTVLEIGCGPGRDGAAFASAGLTYRGVDLSPAQAAQARALGLDAQVASALDLPFAAASFDAAWTMSTLMHLVPGDLPRALKEIMRVLRPGSPLAVGVWGAAEDRQASWDDGTGFGPPRYFNLRTDRTLRAELERHGTIEHWATAPGRRGLHYQWAVIRTPA